MEEQGRRELGIIGSIGSGKISQHLAYGILLVGQLALSLSLLLALLAHEGRREETDEDKADQNQELSLMHQSPSMPLGSHRDVLARGQEERHPFASQSSLDGEKTIGMGSPPPPYHARVASLAANRYQ